MRPRIIPLTGRREAQVKIAHVRAILHKTRTTVKGDEKMPRQIDWYYHRPG